MTIQKPRIAICLSGFIRTWEYTKHSFLDKLCTDYPVDVFVHTYHQNYHEYSARGNQNVFLTSEDITKCLKGIPAKVIQIENRDTILPVLKEMYSHMKDVSNFDYSIKESSDPNSEEIPLGYRIIEQFRKIEECNNLRKWYAKKNNIKYDIVIRARFDMFYTSVLNIPYENMIEGVIYTEDGSMGGHPRDGIVAGRTKTMNEAFNCRYSKLSALFEKNPLKRIPGGSCNCGNIVPCCQLCAHSTMIHLFDMNNVKVVTGFINGLVLRSSETFHKPFFGTVKIYDEDISVKKGLIVSIYPRVMYSEDLQSESVMFNVPSELHNIVLVTNAKRNLSHTLSTLQTVREKIPSAWIVFLEAFPLNVEDISMIYEYTDLLILFYNDNEATQFTKEKSLGETYKICRVLPYLPVQNRIFKITGRYALNEHFNIDNFTMDDKICAQVYNNETRSINYCYNLDKNEPFTHETTSFLICTVLYSIPPKYRKLYHNAMKTALYNLHYDIEHTLYPLIPDEYIHNVQRLGVQGTIGPNEELYGW